MLSRHCAMAFLLFMVVAPAVAQTPYNLKMAKIMPPSDLHQSVLEQLSDNALIIQNDKAENICTIWLRQGIPATANADQIKNGVTYREIPQTTIVGALQLEQNWIDFRKQEIPKGNYTLRLGYQPMDGDHMDTSPHTEFCLLCPAVKDSTTATIEVKAMRELSASAHGSTHPAVMLLFPNDKPADQPKLVDAGKGIWIVQARLDIAATGGKTNLGFGFVIAGHSAAR